MWSHFQIQQMVLEQQILVQKQIILQQEKLLQQQQLLQMQYQLPLIQQELPLEQLSPLELPVQPTPELTQIPLASIEPKEESPDCLKRKTPDPDDQEQILMNEVPTPDQNKKLKQNDDVEIKQLHVDFSTLPEEELNIEVSTILKKRCHIDNALTLLKGNPLANSLFAKTMMGVAPLGKKSITAKHTTQLIEEMEKAPNNCEIENIKTQFTAWAMGYVYKIPVENPPPDSLPVGTFRPG